MLRSLMARVMLLASLSLLWTTPAMAGPVTDPSVQVLANGYRLGFDVEPLIESGRVLVPFRAVAEFYGFEVTYRAEERSVAVTGGGRSVVMGIDQEQAYLDGTPVTMDVPPQVIAGRTLVPLRFAGQALGLQVDWDAATRLVHLSGAGKVAPAVPPLGLHEVKSVRRSLHRYDQRKFRHFTMSADQEAIAALVGAWSGALPAVRGDLMVPMPPYGISAFIELETGSAAVTLAWVCQDDPEGNRGCTNTDEGYVYLGRSGWEAPDGSDGLVYSPALAEFIWNYPLADGQ